jgi:ABC-2 type transport system permease protein
MTAITVEPAVAVKAPPARRPSPVGAWATLASRRMALSAHNPREVLAPLATPILFALVIGPALGKIVHSVVDYRSYVIVGTVGLLIPLTCAFAGIGVIVDRTTGARRELLAAPVARWVIVAGNLAVAMLVSLLQVGTLMLAGWARGSHFDTTGAGLGWFAAAVLLFTFFMYGVAEILGNRIPTQEEYVGLVPVVAIVPWFLAGSLFPITSMPAWLAALARALPATHALALLRYGVVDRHATGLHAIWGMSNPTVEAALSVLVLAAWAAVFTALSMRVFQRSAVS